MTWVSGRRRRVAGRPDEVSGPNRDEAPPAGPRKERKEKQRQREWPCSPWKQQWLSWSWKEDEGEGEGVRVRDFDARGRVGERV